SLDYVRSCFRASRSVCSYSGLSHGSSHSSDEIPNCECVNCSAWTDRIPTAGLTPLTSVSGGPGRRQPSSLVRVGAAAGQDSHGSLLTAGVLGGALWVTGA